MVLLVFAGTLLLAALVSGLAARSVLSTAVLFLVAGFLMGDGVLGVLSLQPGDPIVSTFTELALFAVLFTEGMHVGLRDIAGAWRLPGRALLLGLPIALLATAVLAHVVAGLSWLEAFLLGAALSPTDPVFAAALVGRADVPRRLRRLLNIESGVNDGLALPVVVAMLAVLGATSLELAAVLGEVVLGIALGVAVPWIAIRLERSRLFAAAGLYKPLNAFAIGLLVLAIARLTHANQFLAAFAGGVTIATVSGEVRDAFAELGQLVAELLKLATLLVFGALLTPAFFAEIPASGYLFAVLVLLVVRPFALALALAGSPLTWREWVAAAWFGPKGFASVFYGLLILQSGIGGAGPLFHLVAAVVVASIVTHSSTDVLLARWVRGADGQSPARRAAA